MVSRKINDYIILVYPLMELFLDLQLQVRMDLGVMVMKEYSIFLRSQKTHQ